jgi:hypothetical protein
MQRTPSYSQANDKVTEMNSLSMVMAKAVKNGYTESFKVTGKGMISQDDPEHPYAPEDIQVINFYRFEGESDPADNSIMYQIETEDGHKGVLVDAYGAYADEKTNVFMQQVEDIHKKVEKDDPGEGNITRADEEAGPSTSAA